MTAGLTPPFAAPTWSEPTYPAPSLEAPAFDERNTADRNLMPPPLSPFAAVPTLAVAPELGADRVHVGGRQQPSAPRFPRSYIAVWALAAVVSGTYLTSVALTSRETGESEIAASSTDRDKAIEAAEARAVRFRVALEDFQRDVAQLRTQSSGQADAGLLARLAALEERVSIETGLAVAALPVPAAVGAQVGMPSNASSTSAGTRVAGALATVGPDGQPRLSIPGDTGAIETGSLQTVTGQKAPTRVDVAPAAPVRPGDGKASTSPVVINAAPGTISDAPGAAASTPAQAPVQVAKVVPPPAPVAPAPKPFAVQLASGGSVESLRLSWSVLAQQHGDALGDLQPRFTRSASTPEAGPIFDLIAGPFKTAADAKKACKTLASRGVDCKLGNFGGASL